MNHPTPLFDLVSVFDALNQASVLPTRLTQSLSEAEANRLGVPIDCFTTDDHATVVASLPGAKPEDIQVSVDNDVLTIRGSVKSEHKQQREGDEKVTWFASEITRGTYERRIRLPFAIQADQVEAEFENGLLRVTLPKVAAARPHKVDVKVASGKVAAAVTESSSSERAQASSSNHKEPVLA